MDPFFSAFPYVHSEVLGIKSRGQYLISASHPVDICEKTGGLESFGENLLLSQAVLCHTNMKAILNLHFVFVNVIIL